jgi:signal transduction histidine kinase
MDASAPPTSQAIGPLSNPALVLDAAGLPLFANAAAAVLLGRGDQVLLEALLPPALRAEAENAGLARSQVSLPGQPGALMLEVISLRARSEPGARFLVRFLAARTEAASGGEELEQVRSRLREVQEKLQHSERMASIGQLAAGVAHEINNPIGYVHSNLGTLQEYINNLFGLIELYQSIVYGSSGVPADRKAEIDQHKRSIDYEFLLHDLPQLMAESREGIDRVRRIVQDLRDFSRADRMESWSLYDLHRGLDSTIGIVWNEIKYKAQLHKEYGALPLVECLPSQLNQVFMNILVNAAQAIAENGEIRVRTGREGADHVFVEISDTGCGIPPDLQKRIFDPFFTTKPVGQGTGLGLAISYGIVQKHHGDIQVHSKAGEGTTFRVVLPERQAQQAAA